MKQKFKDTKKNRGLFFFLAGFIHLALISLVIFNYDGGSQEREPPANLFSLIDLDEEIPPEPPPPVFTNTSESIAENMIETEEEPPQTVYLNQIPQPSREEEIVYVSMSRVTDLPVLPEAAIMRNAVHPRIARDSNIEGRVILELFVDRTGVIRSIEILLEDPAGRGFGEAAVNAFRGIRADKPAQVNGEAVAVRYRYPIVFKLN